MAPSTKWLGPKLVSGEEIPKRGVPFGGSSLNPSVPALLFPIIKKLGPITFHAAVKYLTKCYEDAFVILELKGVLTKS